MTPEGSSRGADSPFEAGQLLAGRFELQERLGAGGMGTVFLAADRELDELVALKVLHTSLAETPGALERFRNEVRLARRVTHARVARVFELGEHLGARFVTMEYVPGPSLAQRLQEQERCTVDYALEVAACVCEALEAAHSVGVVHRDIKPDNVLLAHGHRVVVTDFGVAARLGEGNAEEAVGTPAYMAPEQLTGEAATPQTDLFALGVMLFELLTGTLPYQGASVAAVAAARLTGPAPDPCARDARVPASVGALVRLCLARAPEQRPASAAVLRAALTLEQRAQSSSTPRPAPAGMTATARLETVAAVNLPRAPLVAVWPLEAQGEARVERFARELGDELQDALCASPGLRVWSSVALGARPRGEPQLEALARGGVDRLLTGSVRERSGGALRAALRLTDVHNGQQDWAGRFDAHEAALEELVERAAREVEDAVKRNSRRPEAGAAPRHRLVQRVAHGEAAAGLAKALAGAEGDPDLAAANAWLTLRAGLRGEQPLGAELRSRVLQGLGDNAPRTAAGLALRARVELALGRTLEGASTLRALCTTAPGGAFPHAQLGVLLLEARQPREALRRLDAAVARLRAPLATQWTELREALGNAPGLGAALQVESLLGEESWAPVAWSLWCQARGQRVEPPARARSGRFGRALARWEKAEGTAERAECARALSQEATGLSSRALLCLAGRLDAEAGSKARSEAARSEAEARGLLDAAEASASGREAIARRSELLLDAIWD